MNDASRQLISLSELLRIQSLIGISATVIGYPFIAVFWMIRYGLDDLSFSWVFRELITLGFAALATGLIMAVMALVAYPVLKVAYQRKWILK